MFIVWPFGSTRSPARWPGLHGPTLRAAITVVVCDWPRQDAIEEMTEGGFRFNPLWRNLVHYIEHADIDELRRQIAIGIDELDRGLGEPWDPEEIKAEGRRLLAESRKRSPQP